MTKRCNQLFAIQDNKGKFVDKNSIWKDETGKWYYTSKNGYEFDVSMKNLDTGVILSGSIEEAERIINGLSLKIHKLANNFERTFSIIALT
jgi:hypothetical protein